MTKKKFLADLDKRLYILDETERADIINEYNDIIDEKIKHGTIEKDAISEFGNIDSLVEEILKAYKINTKYKSTDAKIKDAASKGEDFIKKAAKGLSEITNDVIDEVKKSNLEISSENVFEVVIKVLLLLVGLSLLRIPFFLVGEFGKTILSNDLFPFMALPYIWSLIVWVFYIISCILIVIVVFREYFFKENKKEKLVSAKVKKEKQEKTKGEVKKEEKIVEKSEPKLGEVKEKTNNALIIILQIFLVFTFFIPVIAFLTGWSAVLAIAIYLLIKEVNTIGIIILTIGVFTISGFFIDLVSTLFSNSKKLKPYSLVVGFVMVVVGVLFTVEMASGIDYIDSMPLDFKQSKSVREYKDINTLELDTYFMEHEKISNETLADGHVIIEVYYYSDYVTINRIEQNKKISIDLEDRNQNPSKLIKSVIKELKDNKIYSYQDLFIPKVKIYANSNTLDNIKITEE